MVTTPNLVEVPACITVGSPEEIRMHLSYVFDFIEGYDTGPPVTVGSRQFLIKGPLYTELMDNPTVRRLGNIKQLGDIRGTWREGGYVPDDPEITRDVYFAGATHTRYLHSLDTAIRMEIATRYNHPYDDTLINLAIASGILHDLYTPPLSEHGAMANREALDEEKNIELIMKDDAILGILNRHGIDPVGVIKAVRGGHPELGRLLNSPGLDLDKVSYTLIDAAHLGPRPSDMSMFGFYMSDVHTSDIHFFVDICDGEPVYLVPEAVRKILYIRSWMCRDVYKSSANRLREAFLRSELERSWGEGILSIENMLSMNDHEFERFLGSVLDPEIHRNIFQQTFPENLEEVGRFYGESEDDVRKRFGDDVMVIRGKAFNPATGTLVRNYWESEKENRAFREMFPRDAEAMESMAASTEYVGVYRKKAA